MALETVVYPQEQHGYICNEFYGYSEQESSILGNNWEYTPCCNYSMMQNQVIKEFNNWDISNNFSAEEGGNINNNIVEEKNCCGRKRKRTGNNKKTKKEEMEKQKMIHIAVERNRRKQMNEYLTLLRNLMPSSYVQRADQASIVGGAINFVKELEHHLRTLQTQNALISHDHEKGDISSSPLFDDFFSFPPQHSNHSCESSAAEKSRPKMTHHIEVNLVENHVNLKILSKKRPEQLIKIVAGLQCLWLTILHLNVTTVDQMVLYSLSTKLEEGCQLTTVKEISEAVNQLLGRIQEEATSNC